MLRRFLILLAALLSGISAAQAAVTTFALSNDPIDVVIPCVEKDLATLKLCIRGIRENGVNIRRIIVVSKNLLTEEAEWFDEARYPFSFQDIAGALAKYKPKFEYLLQKTRRTGWYYQQLLKFYAPLVIPNISPNVLILDSDTIFLNPVTFLNPQNGGMYNTGEEHNPPYFRHGSLLIPGFYKCFPEYSGITHHMIFQRPIIKALIEEVEHYHATSFWQIFCLLVPPDQLPYSGASEYEIYFNYAFSHTNQVTLRKLRWKNIQRLREIDKFKAEGLHYICLHTHDRIED